MTGRINVTDFVRDVGVPVAIATIGLFGALLAAAVTFALDRWSQSAERRRDAYSAATRQLFAYAEYPYRIRRRTSDSPAQLAELADRGHDIQEQLRYHEAWITAESRWLGAIFRDVRQELAASLASACNEAWAHPPVGAASEMTLGQWGPRGVDAVIVRFESAIPYRFGSRRLAVWSRWNHLRVPRTRG